MCRAPPTLGGSLGRTPVIIGRAVAGVRRGDHAWRFVRRAERKFARRRATTTKNLDALFPAEAMRSQYVEKSMLLTRVGAFVRLGRPVFLVGGFAFYALGAAMAALRLGQLDWTQSEEHTSELQSLAYLVC